MASSVSCKISLMNNKVRIIDLSSIDEVASRWNPGVFKKRKGDSIVKKDSLKIEQQVDLLEYYRQKLFKYKEKKLF